MVHLRYVTIDCSDSSKLAGFWAAALGWAVVYDQADGALVADAAGGYPQLYLQPVPEPKTGKNRAHVDLEADDFERELDRLCALGARVISRSAPPSGAKSAVMGDLEGNEFCISEAGGQ
jgi:predicted enzyme related to lactoylglutathione lyase